MSFSDGDHSSQDNKFSRLAVTDKQFSRILLFTPQKKKMHLSHRPWIWYQYSIQDIHIPSGSFESSMVPDKAGKIAVVCGSILPEVTYYIFCGLGDSEK